MTIESSVEDPQNIKKDVAYNPVLPLQGIYLQDVLQDTKESFAQPCLLHRCSQQLIHENSPDAP
jgi:hypothetical protein